jgi:succinylarginine dihydrolase
MKALHDLGIPQAVLPPMERPSMSWLRRFGFSGPDDATLITRAAREAPALLAACSSASAMWTANAATVAPSCDTRDRRVHLTPANLYSKLHRAIEADDMHRVLSTIFANRERFVVHPPLPGGEAMRDEGAANHTRLAANFGDPGVHLFVYGAQGLAHGELRPGRYPARQTREASAAIARHHQLPVERVVHVQQNPVAIDAGVFHNDVIAVGHQNVLFHHELAFAGGEEDLARIQQACGGELILLPVSNDEVPLTTAVQTYLFNSQIVTLPDGSMAIIAPTESAEHPATAACLDCIVGDTNNPIAAIHYFNLRQSMRNGGGPACLRQRIVLHPDELDALHGRVRFDETLHRELCAWVEQHYREEIHHGDIEDPLLLQESRTALDELTRILQLGSLYDFQN